MDATPDPDAIRIGALAKSAGLTVRALHHYDAIGLLVPDERGGGGGRLYSPANVSRLYRILALRQLGLSLDEIAVALDRGPDLTDAVRRHLARVRASIRTQRRLERTLARMLDSLAGEPEPTLDQLIQTIEEMKMTDRYYTRDQQEQLRRRREQLGEAGIAAAEHDWAELIAAVGAERDAGTEPTAPRMLELARRWRGLIEQFTGADDGIRASLSEMYREQGAQTASRGTIDAELMAYVGEALTALDGDAQRRADPQE